MPTTNPNEQVLVLGKFYPYPPARGGDISYSRGLIASLAKHVDVTAIVASVGANGVEVIERDNVKWIVAGSPKSGRVGSVLSPLPNIAWRGHTKAICAEVDKALEGNWGSIVLDNIGSAHLLSRVLRYKRSHPHTTLAYISHEHETSIRIDKYAAYGGNAGARWVMKQDGVKVAKLELDLLRNVDLVTVINSNDQALYENQLPGLRYAVLTPGYEGGSLPSRVIDDRVPRRVLVLGGRESKQKQVILERWLEASAQQFSDAGIEMFVVGPMDESLLNSLKLRYSSVHFAGFVEDLDELLGSCRLCLVPDFVGGGFKVRLLTYVFKRVPMFGLKGAVSGLGLEPGVGFFEVDSLTGLAQEVVRRIDDLDFLNHMQEAAYSGCLGRFEWEDRGAMFAEALRMKP